MARSPSLLRLCRRSQLIKAIVVLLIGPLCPAPSLGQNALVPQGPTTVADNCNDVLIKNITDMCHDSDSVFGIDPRIRGLLLLSLWHCNDSPPPQYHTMSGPDTIGFTKRLEGLGRPMVENIGIGLSVHYFNINSWERDTLMSAATLQEPAMALIAPSMLGDLKEELYGAHLWDLSLLAPADSRVEFSTYHPYYKRASVYNGKIMSLPVDGSMLLLYYNKDSLERANISTPSTLEELMTAARLLNGTNNSYGEPQYGFCFNDGGSDCPLTGFDLMAVFSQMVQTKGTSHGLYIDPQTRQQMLTSAAMRKAVNVLLTLRRYSAPPSDEFGCTTHSKAFALARCAMTIGPTRQWKVNSYNGDQVDVRDSPFQSIRLGPPSNFSRVIGGVGVTTIPGSTLVLDRKRNRLIACTPELCPFGSITNVIKINGQNKSPQRTRVINLAPFPGPGGMTFSLSNPEKGEAIGAYAVFSLIAFAVSTLFSLDTIRNPGMDNGPFRTPHFSDEALQFFIKAGYDGQETFAFLQTMLRSLDHPNRVEYFRTPGATFLLLGLRDATNMVIRGDPKIPYTKLVEEVILQISSSVRPFESGESAERMVDEYLRDIDYVPSPPPEPPAPVVLLVTTDNAKLDTAVFIGIITGSIVGLLMVIAAFWQWHRLCMKKVKNTGVPGISPSTTILVTDIQDSTNLWEELPDTVMTQVLHIHHECIRRQLLLFGGYESTTEGDSFIVSFHNPADALDFAISTQLVLLEAPWPPALLGTSFCAEVLTCTSESQVGPTSSSMTQMFQARATLPKLDPLEDTRAKATPAWIGQGGHAAGHISYGFGRIRFDGFSLTMQNSLVLRMEDSASSPAESSSRRDLHRGGAGGSSASVTATHSSLLTSVCEDMDLPAPKTTTLQSVLSRLYAMDTTGLRVSSTELGPKPQVVYRGLRVRMGFHCGVTQATEVAINAVTNRVAYSGAPMAMAKAIGDAGAGGMVTLTQAALEQLHDLDQPSQLKPPPVVWSLGQFIVKEGMPPVKMYQAFNLRLMTGVVAEPPLRVYEICRPGVLSAPIGKLAVVKVNMVGFKSILAWDAREADEALSVCEDYCHKLASRFFGCMAYSPPGGTLAVFSSPCAAANWALKLMDLMMHHDWSEDLLKHEICEVLLTNNMCTTESRLRVPTSVRNKDRFSILTPPMSLPLFSRAAATGSSTSDTMSSLESVEAGEGNKEMSYVSTVNLSIPEKISPFANTSSLIQTGELDTQTSHNDAQGEAPSPAASSSVAATKTVAASSSQSMPLALVQHSRLSSRSNGALSNAEVHSLTTVQPARLSSRSNGALSNAEVHSQPYRASGLSRSVTLQDHRGLRSQRLKSRSTIDIESKSSQRSEIQSVLVIESSNCSRENSTPSTGSWKDILVARGPRLKVGITFGTVGTKLPLKISHGEVQYHGKVASRAASVASSAHPNEVVCTYAMVQATELDSSPNTRAHVQPVSFCAMATTSDLEDGKKPAHTKSTLYSCSFK